MFHRELLFEIKIREKLDRLFRLAVLELSFPAQLLECQNPPALRGSTAPSHRVTTRGCSGSRRCQCFRFLNLKIKNFKNKIRVKFKTKLGVEAHTDLLHFVLGKLTSRRKISCIFCSHLRMAWMDSWSSGSTKLWSILGFFNRK